MANRKTIEKGFCSLCGRALLPPEGFLALRDESRICALCIRKIRVMHPLTLSWDKKGNAIRSDPIANLTLAEARESLENAIARTEALREQYGGHNAVFEAENVTTEKGGFLKPPVVYVCGRVIYGRFDPQDRVRLLHQGGDTELTLEKVLQVASFGAGAAEGEAAGGLPCALQFVGKGIVCEPGDRIVRD